MRSGPEAYRLHFTKLDGEVPSDIKECCECDDQSNIF